MSDYLDQLISDASSVKQKRPAFANLDSAEVGRLFIDAGCLGVHPRLGHIELCSLIAWGYPG